MEKIKSWKVNTSEEILENPWFTILKQNVTIPDGSEQLHFTVSYTSPAVGIIVMHEGKFLLINQYRFRIEKSVWAIPSGGINANESALDAAERELLEETGYKANSLQHLISFNPSYGSSNQLYKIYLAGDLIKYSDNFDSNEVISIQWFSKKEILKMIKDSQIVDALSLVPLLLVFLET